MITVIYLDTAPGVAAIVPVTALREAGHQVTVVTRQAPTPEVAAAFDALVVLPASRLPAVRVRRGKLVLAPDRLPAALRIRSLGAVREADVLIAGDDLALPAVWLASRTLRQHGPRRTASARPVALRGLPAAIARLHAL